jgi:hypothetical protein
MENVAIQEAGRLVEYGVVGLFLLIAMAVIVFLFRQLTAATAARLEEALKLAQSREEMAKTLNANTLALEGNNRAMEARTRATEAVERALAELKAQQSFTDQLVAQKLEAILEQGKEGLKRAEDAQRAIAAIRGNPQ